jgi:hypothetical protein
MNDNLLDYLKSLEENTAITMDNEQLGNREVAFTSYVLSQIATKVGADNYEVLHAEIKNSAGSYLGELFTYNESENQEVLTLFYTIYDASSNEKMKMMIVGKLSMIHPKFIITMDGYFRLDSNLPVMTDKLGKC